MKNVSKVWATVALIASALVFSAGTAIVHAENGIPVAGNSAAIAALQKLSLGPNTTCTIRSEGHTVCWGRDFNASFGTGWRQATVGDTAGSMGGALKRTVISNANGIPVHAKAVYAGGDQSCLLDVNNVLRCVGSNSQGNLGRSDGLATSSFSSFAGESSIVNVGTGRYVVDLATGGDDQAGSGNNQFHCALLDDGSVKCWGSNANGQLGIGNITSPANMIGDTAGEMGDNLAAVNLGTGVTATAVVAGLGHACAIVTGGSVTTGSVKCWGNNASAQLGLGSIVSPNDKIGDSASEMGDSLPTINLGTGRTARALSAGFNSTCAILDNGNVVCWGYNSLANLGRDTVLTSPNDKIGDASSEMGNSLVPVALGVGRTAAMITSGGNHSCALLDDGNVKCWGYNYSGQLGQGDTVTRGDATNKVLNTPAIDLGLNAGETVLAIRAGGNHNCVYTSASRIKCWGKNSSYQTSGQLGLEDAVNRGDVANQMGTNLPAVNFAPNTPAEVGVVMTPGATSMTFALTPTAMNGTLDHYEYDCTTNGSYSGTYVAASGANFTLTQIPVFGTPTNLVSGQTLSCRIRAVNENGAGLMVIYQAVVGTPLVVTASSHVVEVGASVPTITGSPSVNGVNRSGETCTTAYTNSSAVGTYATTCSGGTAATYSVSYVAGVITVILPRATISSVSPPNGATAGGTAITITGTNFRAGATVTVGGVACTSVVVVSATSITCTTGAGTGSSQNIVVTNSDSYSGTGSSLYSFVAPTTTTTTTTTTTSTTLPKATSSSAGDVAPQLVTAANQAQLESAPGEATAIINGKEVNVDVVKAPVDATPAQLLKAAETIVADIASLLPAGVKNPVSVMSTSTGPEINGIMVNPDDPTEKLGVPVESVQLVKAGDTAVLLAALNQTNLPAEKGSGGALEVTRGGIVSATAYGLPGSETGEIVLMSTPRLLQTFTVDTNGGFKGQVALPKNIAFGSHTVVMATKNAKVSLGIKLVRTKMLFRIKRVIGTTLFKNRAGVQKAGGKVSVSASGRCRANSKKITMAAKPGGCYITVRQAAKGAYKAVYYRFTVSVVKKLPKKVLKK